MSLFVCCYLRLNLIFMFRSVIHEMAFMQFLITCTGRIPFTFLEDIHGRFVKTYGRACHTAPAYAMNDEFSRVLSQQMEYYSNDPNADRMNRIKGEMSQVMHRFFSNDDKNFLEMSCL